MGLDPDLSAVFLHQSLGDGQAQSRPTMFSTFDLIKFFEDLFNLVLRNSDPSISDLMEDKGILLTGGDGNLASIGRELESIEEEVDKDITEPSSIGIDLQVIGDLNLN